MPWIHRIALLSLLLISSGFRTTQRGEDPTYRRVFEQLRKMIPRNDRVASVHDLTLRREVAEFRLRQGALYFLSPVGDRTVATVFIGDGSVSFRPPLQVERDHMHRVLGDSAFDATPISAAVFIFADSTLAELEHQVTLGAGDVEAGASGPVGDALDYLTDGGERWVHATLMSGLLNGVANGFFAAFIKRQRGEHLMFEVDPQQVEEILLLRRGRLRDQRVETVCQFQRAEDRDRHVAAADEHPDPLDLKAYRIEATIKGDGGFSASATVHLSARRDSISWTPFSLYRELDVDSVLDEAGKPAAFFRAKGSSALWVRFSHALSHGETDSVRIVYQGDLITYGSIMQTRGSHFNAPDRWFFLKSTETWFPRYSSWQPADMDLTYHTPKSHRFASIGRLVDTKDEGSVRTTHWVTEFPTQEASFNIGEFEELQLNDPRIPPVTVHMNREAHRILNQLFPSRPIDPQHEVGSDVANSLAFFTNAFGPPLFHHYYATEIPYFHGQAFPGLIHLSWWTFQSVSEKGFEESFRAHEMAHQWWGIGVEPAGYRDVWLSEGFAMFAGLWYMQLILRDNEKYFKQLKDWREAIRGARQHSPPIGLGWRLVESDPSQYDLIIYRKGAWVLQMLRNMMLDFRTMKEDAFRTMMQDFYQTYRGRHASTKDFQTVVERHLHQPMDWFFDQWVDGTAVPTYTYSWHAERAPDGQYRLRVRVRQEDVPHSFTMPIPLLIDFANGDRAVMSVKVHGPLTEQEWTLPREPTQVQLDPLESVLAEVKQEGWH